MALRSFSAHSLQWTQPETSVAGAPDRAQCPQEPALPGRQASPVTSDTAVPHVYIHTGWASIASLFDTEKKTEPTKSLRLKLTDDKRIPSTSGCPICHFFLQFRDFRFITEASPIV